MSQSGAGFVGERADGLGDTWMNGWRMGIGRKSSVCFLGWHQWRCRSLDVGMEGSFIVSTSRA